MSDNVSGVDSDPGAKNGEIFVVMIVFKFPHEDEAVLTNPSFFFSARLQSWGPRLST